MQIPVDFSHRVTVEELDTGKRAVYLIIRGTNEKVRVPAGQAQELEESMPMPPPAEQLGAAVVRTVEHEQLTDDDVLPAPTMGLSPGTLGGSIKPQDAFGADEG